MRLKIPYYLIIVLFFGFTCQSQTIIPGGYVSGTWDEAGSPYIVQGPIKVHLDSSLIITKNVMVEFCDTAFLEVYGHISAIGNHVGWNQFKAHDVQWQGIRIIGEGLAQADSTSFKYCSFEYGSDSLYDLNGGVLSILDRDKVNITQCLFRYNYAEHRGGALYVNNSDILINQSFFSENSTGLNEGLSQGGAVYLQDSDVDFKQVEFDLNESLVGGALYSDQSSFSIIESFFMSNESNGGGGAVVCHHSGDIYISDCLFEDNVAHGSGGAIAFLEGINGHVENCEFIWNWAQSETFLSDGAGVFITPYDNEVNIVNCKFDANVAGNYGGGVYAGSPTRVVGCLFTNNEASNSELMEGGGGAICLAETSLLIFNSTFSHNFGGIGKTIYCQDAELSFINSILWDGSISTDNKIFLATFDDPPTMFIDHSDVEGGTTFISGTGAYILNWASGNLSEYPLFEWIWGDYSLAWNSPCINAGRSDTLQLLIPIEDLAGNPRIMGGEIDMGCYEYQGPISIPEKVKNEDFVVYPNPAKDHIYIRSGREFDGRLTISDLSGRKVVDREVNISKDSPIRQALPGIPAGFYILNLNSKDYSLSQKLIIN